MDVEALNMLHELEEQYGSIAKVPEDNNLLKKIRRILSVPAIPHNDDTSKPSVYNIKLVKKVFNMYKYSNITLPQICKKLNVCDVKMFRHMRKIYDFDKHSSLSISEIADTALKNRMNSKLCTNIQNTKKWLNRINGKEIY